MLKINIPTPCHEDWNAMIPNTQGRHCNACAKTVVDFTAMTDDEVKYFFLNKKEGEKVCGRFRNEQLQRITIALPNNIFTLQMPLWKKYLAAILIAFSTMLFSCDTHLQGEPAAKVEEQTLGGLIEIPEKIDTLIGDTIYPVKPLPPPQLNVVGVLKMPLITKGNISVVPVPPINEIGIIEIADTPKIENKYDKVGEVIFVEKDSAALKKDKTKDSVSCDKKIYY